MKKYFPTTLDFNSRFYKNCKRQRKLMAKICQVCPFRAWIEQMEKQHDKKVSTNIRGVDR